jgi:outer membrane biosynthesis protein TonB
VVRTATLRLAPLAVLVALGHFASLEWLARQADAISGLTLMPPPMYTRLLQPTEPPPVTAMATPAPPAKPPARMAPKPKPPASSPEEGQHEEEPAPAEPVAREEPEPPEPLPEEAVAQAPDPAAPEPLPAASASVAAASAPASAASAPAADPGDEWPTNTRLTYDVTGEYRDRVSGSAHVHWQRDRNVYQVQLDVTIRIVVPITQTITSQGEVTPAGLVPRVYEEARTGGRRRSAKFGDQMLVLEKGITLPRPPGVQDTASQFVELAQRFATGKEVLAVGRTVKVWLARPGGLDEWTYDVVKREVLALPLMGDVEAFHLKPRMPANPRGNITAEMWFAPSLQYLPVKIKVVMGNEAWLDLLVERIEQR